MAVPFTEIALSDLELFEKLHSGLFGPVYRGRWKSKGTIVAIKKVNLLLQAKEKTVRYVLDLDQTRSWSCSFCPVQFEKLSSLSHRNIVQFLGVARTMPTHYLVAGASQYAYGYCKILRLLELICLSKVVVLLVTKTWCE